MILDCAVIGGGPAGLNAALVLGRSRRKTILFDDNKPRNAVTSESHGFITRDGIHPQEFKRVAQEELSRYPDVRIEKQRVYRINKENTFFQVETENGEVYSAKKIILATGFKEVLPDIPRVEEFYGKSLFSCPFCDGWELRDRPLAVIANDQKAFHMAKLVSNWTNDLIIFTNGNKILSLEEQELLKRYGISINEKKIATFIGENRMLKKIQLEDGTKVLREGGFISVEWKQAASFDSTLKYTLNEHGGIETDSWQRTNTEGVFACGDTRIYGPSQLIIGAAEGSMAAISVITALTEEKFNQDKQPLKRRIYMHHPHGKNSKEKVSYLESPERRKEFSPEQLLNMIPLKETDSILDFGAGTGYFSIPVAKRTTGKVYALDIDAAMLAIIKEKSLKEQLSNIVPVQGSMEELPSPEGTIDMIIASLILHEIQPLGPLLQQMRNVLKKEGHLICLELEPKGSSDKGSRITLEGMEREMKEAGFQVTEKYFPSESLYMLVAQRRD